MISLLSVLINLKSQKCLVSFNSFLMKTLFRIVLTLIAVSSVAFLFRVPLTQFLFNNKSTIISTLKKNAKKIYKDSAIYKADDTNQNKENTLSSIIPVELKKKVNSENYNPSMLTPDEEILILNGTMTFQLIIRHQN